MTLIQKQQRFVVLVAALIDYATTQGYLLTFGEALRSAEEAARLTALDKGIPHSLHCVSLAIDLHLFVDGVYQTNSEAYRPLGIWWTAQSSLPNYECCWGGLFTRADGNHFSIAHEGRA